jgi:hypothetical protein
MTAINQATMSNVSGLRQTENSAKRMSGMTASMRDLVRTFSQPKTRRPEYKMA